MVDPSNTLTILRALAAAYPNFTLHEESVAVYVDMLSDIEPDLLRLATLDIISRSRFFPTVAEIREAAYTLRQGPQLSAAEAWGATTRAMIELGHGHDPSGRLNERTLQAIRDIGGWEAICMSENAISDRARFIEAYNVRLGREQREGVALPQIADLARRLSSSQRQLADHADSR